MWDAIVVACWLYIHFVFVVNSFVDAGLRARQCKMVVWMIQIIDCYTSNDRVNKETSQVITNVSHAPALRDNIYCELTQISTARLHLVAFMADPPPPAAALMMTPCRACGFLSPASMKCYSCISYLKYILILLFFMTHTSDCIFSLSFNILQVCVPYAMLCSCDTSTTFNNITFLYVFGYFSHSFISSFFLPAYCHMRLASNETMCWNIVHCERDGNILSSCRERKKLSKRRKVEKRSRCGDFLPFSTSIFS